MRLGAIEAGGTKFVVAIGDENGNVLERDAFPTTSPEETVQNIFKFFDGKDIEALGLGCFGPIDPDLKSPTYGYITTTPKPGWTNYNIVGAIQEHYPGLPIGFDTDVNGAALGEAYFGAAKGLDSALYLTIGTGIGGGAIVEGNLVHGLLHPEMGHMMLTVREDDQYAGKCPYHGTCFEGLAAGPSLEARTGIRGELIEQNSEVWDVQAYYIAQAAVQATVLYRPEVIVFGGGVMGQEHMLRRVREKFTALLNGYLPVPDVTEYIVTPAVSGNGSATLGNFALAKDVADKHSRK